MTAVQGTPAGSSLGIAIPSVQSTYCRIVGLKSIIHHKVESGGVPKYTFTIQLEGQVQEAPRSETLRDDAAALEYACDMAREFRNSGSGSHDPNLMIKVRAENRQIIFSIPFRAGSA